MNQLLNTELIKGSVYTTIRTLILVLFNNNDYNNYWYILDTLCHECITSYLN